MYQLYDRHRTSGCSQRYGVAHHKHRYHWRRKEEVRPVEQCKKKRKSERWSRQNKKRDGEAKSVREVEVNFAQITSYFQERRKFVRKKEAKGFRLNTERCGCQHKTFCVPSHVVSTETVQSFLSSTVCFFRHLYLTWVFFYSILYFIHRQETWWSSNITRN